MEYKLNQMKIKFVSPLPKSGCGVADYTQELVTNLINNGIDSEIISLEDWSVKNLFKLNKKINLKDDEVLHIQYPSQPYGKSLIINLLGILKFRKFALTLHEYSQGHLFRKISGLILCFCAKEIIFTNALEKGMVTNILPYFKEHSHLINIGSNIPLKGVNKQFIIGRKIAFFGLLRPNKGLEQFFELIKLSKERNSGYQFIIIGSRQSGSDEYFQDALKQMQKLEVSTFIDQPADKVAEILSTANFCYLHYPDGVSERRGSFLAAVGNNLIVLTNTGASTTSVLDKCYIDCKTPQEAHKAIETTISSGNIDLDKTIINQYLLSKDWAVISKLHLTIYNGFKKNRN